MKGFFYEFHLKSLLPMMLGCGFVFGFIMEGASVQFAVFSGLAMFWAGYVLMHVIWSHPSGGRVAHSTPSVSVNTPSLPTLLNYPLINAAGDFVVYHGTPDATKVRKIIREGLKPGGGNLYGTGVYMSEDFEDAKKHSDTGGRVLELHIRSKTPYKIYEDLPGDNSDEKWSSATGGLFHPLIWVKRLKWFVCFGSKGAPVQIPGLKKVVVRDYWGNKINA